MTYCFLAATICLAACSDDTEDSKLDTGVAGDIGVIGDTGGGQDKGTTADQGGTADTGGATDTGGTADAGPMVCDKGKPVDADAAFAKIAGTYEGTAGKVCTLVGSWYTENKKYKIIISAAPKQITFKTDKADIVATWDGKQDSACQLMTMSTIIKVFFATGQFATLTFDASNKVLAIGNHICLLGNPVKQ